METLDKNIEIVIGVMSDLHCHYPHKGKGGNAGKKDTYLTADLLRNPAKNHPVEALIQVIDEAGEKTPKLTVDYLLCPGDVSNMADPQGFIVGWGLVKEVGEALHAKDTFATLGNHDVDSRRIGSTDIYQVAKGIKNGFPMKDPELCDKFWSQGFAFVELDDVRLLNINTVFFHQSKSEIDKGKVDSTQLEAIERYLTTKDDGKVKIALCHHHPIVHERLNLGLPDVIENGNNLIDLLNKFKFDLVIHGHKHDPWLRYAPGESYTVPVFSAGSFSATTNLILTGKRNTFHIITISKNKDGSFGKIKTWEFLPNIGWKLADSGEESFPMNSGFGFRGTINQLVTSAAEIAKDQPLDWNAFIKLLPEVQYLTPDGCKEFREKLEKEHNIVTHPELPKTPKIIGELSTGNQ